MNYISLGIELEFRYSYMPCKIGGRYVRLKNLIRYILQTANEVNENILFLQKLSSNAFYTLLLLFRRVDISELQFLHPVTI